MSDSNFISHFCHTVQNLPDNPGAEILRYGWQKPDIISLGQGEGSAPTADFILKATFEAMKQGKTFYGPVLGQPALRAALSDYYKRIFNVNIPQNRVFVTGSGTTAMHLALTSILNKGDEVIAVTPIWKNLLGAIELTQAKTVQVSLDYDEEQAWTLDLEKIFDAYTSKTKAILIVTPSNPTGWVMKTDEMRTVLDFARQKGIWVISDEVYNRSLYNATRSPSFLDIAVEDDFLMTVNSFSKSWAMTGWRLGWLTGPAFAESVIRDIALYDNMGAPTFTQYGAIAALEQGEAFIQEQHKTWSQNLDFLTARFENNPKIQSYRPEATFYSFFRVKDENDSLAFAKKLIDEGNLSLAPGCAFGKTTKDWMRLCFAVSPDKLEKAIDRLEKVVG